MRPLPADPMAQNDRLIAAWCADYENPELRNARQAPRADAVVSVARHTREAK